MNTPTCFELNSGRITTDNNVQYLFISGLEQKGIRHFFTTKNSYGGSRIPFDMEKNFITVKQVHGDNILIIDSPVNDINSLAADAKQRQSDAIITNRSHIGIGVYTADCLPILLCDPVRSVIAAVHAGWRGTIMGILSKVVCQMVYIFKCQPDNILAGMGPAIGSCCYAVGETVIEPLKSVNPEWERFLIPTEYGKAKLDLTSLNIMQIEDAGILSKNIYSVGLCTSCSNELFFSYRRDGISTGRMVSGIMLVQ